MHLEIKTAIFLTGFSALVMSVSLLASARFYPERSRTIRLWAGACGGLALAWILIGMRGVISNFLSIVAGNTLIIFSASVYYRAIKEFREQTFKPLLPSLMVGTSIAAMILFKYVLDSVALRAGVISCIGGILTLMCAASILSSRERPRPFSHWVTASTFILCGIVSEARFFYLILVNHAMASVFVPGTMQDIIYICIYGCVVVSTFGFVMMLNDKSNAALVRALAEVKTLSGLLPICAYCKNIRDDQNYWQKMESYISARTDTQFSHSICPDCYAKEVRPKVEAFREAEKCDA
jgi:hypothetical protein